MIFIFQDLLHCFCIPNVDYQNLCNSLLHVWAASLCNALELAAPVAMLQAGKTKQSLNCSGISSPISQFSAGSVECGFMPNEHIAPKKFVIRVHCLKRGNQLKLVMLFILNCMQKTTENFKLLTYLYIKVLSILLSHLIPMN